MPQAQPPNLNGTWPGAASLTALESGKPRYTHSFQMNTTELTREILATYERHGWQLRRVLLCPETRDAFGESAETLFEAASVTDSDFDALWFARASHANREAWELRLLAAQPYALFETFEADESEEQRDDVRKEMENRMREHVSA
jgi:hypothetical protein